MQRRRTPRPAYPGRSRTPGAIASPILIAILSGCLLSSCCSLTPSDCKRQGCTDQLASNFDPAAEINDGSCRYDSVICGTVPVSLDISAVLEDVPSQAWVGVGVMLFEHYGIPNRNTSNTYGCNLVGILGYARNGPNDPCNLNCASCTPPSNSVDIVNFMLENFPKIACSNRGTSAKRLIWSQLQSEISTTTIAYQLSAFQPVVVWIEPPGFPNHEAAHPALIVNSRYVANRMSLVVDDPFNYTAYNTPNPYLSNKGTAAGEAGSYLIDAGTFAASFGWSQTWDNIKWLQ